MKGIFQKINWKLYALEFLSVFVAVFAAFALNNWNENRKESHAESKILLEIYNGLEEDLRDMDTNILGHEFGLKACEWWRVVISGGIPDSLDHFHKNYLRLTRDFTAIQNTSGYQTLKSKGFEIIEDDSLRSSIIKLYEIQYQILQKTEEEYHESQFQENYFESFNQLLSPSFEFNEEGQLAGLRVPMKLESNDKKRLLSYLWKIEVNRQFIMKFYQEVITNIESLRQDIGEYVH